MGPSMIGILIIAHDSLGEGLARAVTHVLGSRPPQFEVLSIPASDDPFTLLPAARELVSTLDTGAGVLIFSDIYGASPCNLVGKLLKPGRVEGVAGRQSADAGARDHLPQSRDGDHGQEGHLRRLRRRVAHGDGSEPMPQREVEIVNKLGLHARASAKLTQLAAKYQCDIVMSRNNRKVNAKSIMGVMMLAAGKGAKVTFETSGPDEAEAMEAIVALINDHFGEGQ